MLTTIIITSYNYQDYLSQAIESALHQTRSDTEVIVVDDGSDDDSREIISSYGDKVIKVFQNNQGQAAAFNAGFLLSSGDWIIFLDSDDVLMPEAVETLAHVVELRKYSKAHWNLYVVDESNKNSESLVRSQLSAGDLTEQVLVSGADGYTWPPTSGNAWSRSFLNEVLPIPVKEYASCPDYYLATLAPIFGEVCNIEKPLGYWRHHHQNASFRYGFEANLIKGLALAETALEALCRHGGNLGLHVDKSQIRRNSRWHQMKYAVDWMLRHISEGEDFILVDQDDWKTGVYFYGRKRHLFLERNGIWWGMPKSDTEAISELEIKIREGVAYIVVVWPYLWFLEFYSAFTRHLDLRYKQIVYNDRICAWALR